MSSGMYFVALPNDYLNDVIQDADNLEAVEGEENVKILGFDSEYGAILYLLSEDIYDWDDEDNDVYTSSFIEDSESCDAGEYLRPDEVEDVAKEFKRLTISHLKRRFDSDLFKSAIDEGEIYRGNLFNNDKGFEVIASAFDSLVNFFEQAASEKNAVIFYYV